MVELDDIRVGQELYYMYFKVSSGVKHRPTLATVSEINPTYKFQVTLSSSICPIMSSPQDLYKTAEEAWEVWNSRIYDRMDYLQSKFEKKINILKKDLYDYRRGI